MEVIPAIDLKDGRCVRLYQGDFNMQTTYSEKPVEVALKWQSLGATRLHIIDLNGADLGAPYNMKAINSINDAVWIPLEVGGGIRDMKTIEELLKIGIDRVILGTVAVEEPELVKDACRRFGESIIIGVDARDGTVATQGWKKNSGRDTVEFTLAMVELGVRRFIYTDISRDGTLTEPNFIATFELVDAVRCPVIASGGVSSLIHIKLLNRMGVEGVIVGKALYSGDINLEQAISAVN